MGPGGGAYMAIFASAPFSECLDHLWNGFDASIWSRNCLSPLQCLQVITWIYVSVYRKVLRNICNEYVMNCLFLVRPKRGCCELFDSTLSLPSPVEMCGVLVPTVEVW